MIEDDPKVSIIIPVYNGSNYLREAIDSALAQTYKNTEVIVINDGSDDDGKTEAIAKSYGDRLRYYKKENNGVSSALNLGIREMTGEYFSWLSHDDIYYPHKIEKQICYFFGLENKRSVVYSHNDIVESTGKLIKEGGRYRIDQTKLYFYILAKRFISGCTLLVPKVVFNEVGLFSEKYSTVQDFEMWFRIINNNFNFCYLPIPVVKSRLHNQQDSIVKADIFVEERNNFFIDVQKWLKKDLWINKWKNKSLGYFVLALNYKKIKLYKTYYYDLEMGLKCLNKLTFFQRVKAVIFYVYVISWNRYLSPYSYINKLLYWSKTYKIR